METRNENQDQDLNKQINTELFEKSAALKKKHNLVTEKLEHLKKQSDAILTDQQAAER